MEPRVLRVERVFPNSFLQGRDYSWFQYVFNSLVEEMKFRIVGCFMDKQATFVLNREMYRLFYSVAPMNKGSYWDGIYIIEDLTPELLPWDKDEKPKGRILLEYREPVYIPFELMERRNTMPLKDGNTATFYFDILGTCITNKPHIDHVKFNGPATIVFWKDGTKTVVKYDGKTHKDYRQAILYAFIRKIYGEGRPYHNILNEIEEVMEQELWMPLPEKGPWIPVSEELPKKSGKYWCTFGGTNITGIDYYTTKLEAEKLFDYADAIEECSGWRSKNVIAWMPLPEPYKGGC